MIKKDMFKKIASVLLLVTVLFTTVLTPIAKAQVGGGSWYNQSFQEWYTKVYDDSNPNEIFGERYTAAQVQWIFYSIAALLVPLSDDVAQCVFTGEITSGDCRSSIRDLLSPPENNNQSSNSENLIAAIAGTNRPISSFTYFRDVATRWNLVPEARAQESGFGFTALNPILGLWRVSRNISFAIFVLIIIAISFMIMFRVKLSPQTVITIQSALPKLAITLVLITFSYAIVGLLIDLVYVVLGLMSLALSSSNVFDMSSTALFNLLTSGATVDVNIPVVGGAGALGLILIYMLHFALAFFVALFSSSGLVGKLVLALNAPSFLTGLSLITFLVTIVVFVLLLWSTIKILWMLVKTFVNILLLSVFAPLQIAMGAISPGLGFGTWLKSMLANLSVYPVTGLLFLVSFVFLAAGFHVGAEDSVLSFIGFDNLAFMRVNSDLFAGSPGWAPPLTLGTGSGALSLIWLAASLMVMFIVPKTAEIIKSLIQGRPFDYGTAIGQAVTPLPGRLIAAQGEGYYTQRAEQLERFGGSARQAGIFRALARALGMYGGRR